MEVKVIEVGEDYVRFTIRGEDHTYLNLLQHYLLEDDDVIIAKYDVSHPLQDSAEFFVKTNGKDPLKALKEANERIIEVCNKLLSQM